MSLFRHPRAPRMRAILCKSCSQMGFRWSSRAVSSQGAGSGSPCCHPRAEKTSTAAFPAADSQMAKPALTARGCTCIPLSKNITWSAPSRETARPSIAPQPPVRPCQIENITLAPQCRSCGQSGLSSAASRRLPRAPG